VGHATLHTQIYVFLLDIIEDALDKSIDFI
jgi:hypothetical protein